MKTLWNSFEFTMLDWWDLLLATWGINAAGDLIERGAQDLPIPADWKASAKRVGKVVLGSLFVYAGACQMIARVCEAVRKESSPKESSSAWDVAFSWTWPWVRWWGPKPRLSADTLVATWTVYHYHNAAALEAGLAFDELTHPPAEYAAIAAVLKKSEGFRYIVIDENVERDGHGVVAEPTTLFHVGDGDRLAVVVVNARKMRLLADAE